MPSNHHVLLWSAMQHITGTLSGAYCKVLTLVVRRRYYRNVCQGDDVPRIDHRTTPPGLPFASRQYLYHLAQPASVVVQAVLAVLEVPIVSGLERVGMT